MTVIATGQQSPTGIDVDATHVYWANQAAGTVVRCPKTGCTGAPEVLASAQPTLRGVSVDAQGLYFMTEPSTADGGFYNVRVLGCPLAGCSGTPSLFYEGSAFRPNDVQARAGTLYFTHWPLVSSCPTSGCTGTPTEVVAGGGPIAIDLDSQYLYLARVGVGAVHRCPPSGCGSNPTVMLGSIRPISIALDETSLYVSDYDVFQLDGADGGGEGRIVVCPIAGCGSSPPVVLASGGISPYAIAVDADRVYFTNFMHGTVVAIPK
jgi:hypothetical protein